jgi:DNA-binding NarL/FixJ family response regulator
MFFNLRDDAMDFVTGRIAGHCFDRILLHNDNLRVNGSRIRERTADEPALPALKVIMVSAIGHKQQVLEAIKIGAKSYVVKPIEKARFLDIINKVADQK